MKDKYAYWMGLQLLLRLIAIVFTALDKQLSLLLNLLIVLVFASYLSITSPFKDNKHTILEWSLLINLVFIFSCTLYYGQNKTETYYIIVSILVLCGFLTFTVVTIYQINNIIIKKAFAAASSWFNKICG